MGYLGLTPTTAQQNYLNIDDISGSFNGTTTSFALQVGSVAPNPFPVTNSCLISVGGVIQEPDDTGTSGFRISGSNIVFSSAPGTGEDFFGLILAGADYLNIGANFPVGTVGSPSITFDGDTNTGIYHPSADELGLVTGGSDRVRVDSNGRVGIGTNSPGVKLDIVDNSSEPQLRLSSSTTSGTTFRFVNTAPNGRNFRIGSNYVLGNGEFALFDDTASVSRILVNSSGNVGIGTTSPSHLLHLNKSGSSCEMRITSSNSDFLIQAGDAGDDGLHFYDVANTQYRMMITNAGRVGIGTTTPDAELDVNGRVYLTQGNEIAWHNGAGTQNSRISGSSTNELRFEVTSSATRAMTIDSSTRVLLGGTSTSHPHLLQIDTQGSSRNGARIEGFTIGNSNGEYPSAGYNIRFTGTANNYQYAGGDYAVMIRYGQSSGRIETFTAGSGTGGNTISFTAGPYVANLGTSWTNSSDERLKTDLAPIEDALTKVGTLRAVTGRYKTDESTKRRSFLIAQDVQAVLPEAVDSVDPDNLGLSYSDVIPLLVAALKESKERTEALEAEVAALKAN